jgi:very-short-patch-repair endonuclease
VAGFLSQWATLVQHPTRHELEVERVVCTLGVPYRMQYLASPYILDFYFPEHRLVLEIDGDSHFTPAGKDRDRTRDKALVARGMTVLHVTNIAVDNGTQTWLPRLCSALEAAVREPVVYVPRNKKKPRSKKLKGAD